MNVAFIVNGDKHRLLLNARPTEERSSIHSDVEFFHFRCWPTILESKHWDLVVVLDCARLLGDSWWTTIKNMSDAWVIKDTR